MLKIKTPFIALVFLGLILTSWGSFAEDFKVQRVPLSFRPGPKLGVIANALVEGQKLPLLVDTGAAGHDLDYGIVQKLKIHQGRIGSGSTPNGDIQTIDIGTVHIQIDGTPIDLHDTITVKNAQGGLADDGIFGLISPPKLAVGKLVVLDLAEPALYFVKSVPKSIPQWLRSNFKNVDFDEVARVPAAPYVEIVNVETKPFGPLKMTLDSGAVTSYFYSDAQFDLSNPVTIRLQKHECITRMAVVRPTSAPGHQNHLLGMDCLRGKILAFPPAGDSSTWIGWPRK